MFQSLTGRLKTKMPLMCYNIAQEFQSLTGRLKTCRHLALEDGADECFNPSQVG